MTVPGIYVQEQTYNLNSLHIDSRCLAGFVGVAEQGPLNEPVPITRFDEYLKIFGGFETEGILPGSIYSFFRNGGKECVVVRVADEEKARRARFKIEGPRGRIILTARTPGTWGNRIVVNVWKENPESFSVTLNFGSKTESFIHLSYNRGDERYYGRYISRNSSLCTAECEGEVDNVEPMLLQPFSGGEDGVRSLNAGHFIGRYRGLGDHAGIGCFESREDIALIAAPDLRLLDDMEDVVAVQKALIDQAERFRDRFAVLDVPEGLDTLAAADWAKRMRGASAAAYYPFVQMTDPTDKTGIGTVRMPPSGGVCGCMAAVDGERGIFCAPANRILGGAVGLARKITPGEHEMLYAAGVNVLKYFPGRGVKIWGVKTLSHDTEWQHINVRRTFSRVCSSLKEGTRWAVFETNDKNMRKRLVRQVSGFLLDLWRDGYFAGSTPEQGFYVRCDEELNPPENIDAGILTCEVGVAIVRPAEFFKITLSAEKDGAGMYLQND